MKKLYDMLFLGIACLAGVSVGYGITLYLDYSANPDLFNANNSAPWYTDLLFLALLITSLMLVRMGMRFKMQQQEKVNPIKRKTSQKTKQQKSKKK